MSGFLFGLTSWTTLLNVMLYVTFVKIIIESLNRALCQEPLQV